MSKPPPRVVSAAPRLRARAKQERRAHQLRLLRRTGWVALACLPFAAAAWVLLGSQLLAVEKVSISGTGRVSAAQVRSIADVTPGMPLARVDTASIADRLRALPPVASVSVSRQWPHELRISIVERVVVVAQKQGTGYVLLDDAGVHVATSATVPRGAVVLVSTSTPATTAALAVLHSLPQQLRGLLSSVQAASAEQVTLLLRDHRQVLWGGSTDGATKAAAVMVLLKMPGTFFDVSAKGVVTRR